MKPEKTMLNLQADTALKEKLESSAKARECSVSQVMRDALEFVMDFDLAIFQQVQILASRMNANPAKVAEAIITHRLAAFKAESDHDFGEPILGEFLFGPNGLIGGSELHLLSYNKRIRELDLKWEKALEMKKSFGAELNEYEMSFLNRRSDPEKWKTMWKGGPNE